MKDGSVLTKKTVVLPLTLLCCLLWEWDVYGIAFLQFVTWLLHLRISAYKLFNSDVIATSYAEDCFAFFHFMNRLYLLCVSIHAEGKQSC